MFVAPKTSAQDTSQSGRRPCPWKSRPVQRHVHRPARDSPATVAGSLHHRWTTVHRGIKENCV